MGNLPALAQHVQGRCNHSGGHPPLQEVGPDGKFFTSQAQEYPAVLNKALAPCHLDSILQRASSLERSIDIEDEVKIRERIFATRRRDGREGPRPPDRRVLGPANALEGSAVRQVEPRGAFESPRIPGSRDRSAPSSQRQRPGELGQAYAPHDRLPSLTGVSHEGRSSSPPLPRLYFESLPTS